MCLPAARAEQSRAAEWVQDHGSVCQLIEYAGGRKQQEFIHLSAIQLVLVGSKGPWANPSWWGARAGQTLDKFPIDHRNRNLVWVFILFFKFIFWGIFIGQYSVERQESGPTAARTIDSAYGLWTFKHGPCLAGSSGYLEKKYKWIKFVRPLPSVTPTVYCYFSFTFLSVILHIMLFSTVFSQVDTNARPPSHPPPVTTVILLWPLGSESHGCFILQTGKLYSWLCRFLLDFSEL